MVARAGEVASQKAAAAAAAAASVAPDLLFRFPVQGLDCYALRLGMAGHVSLGWKAGSDDAMTGIGRYTRNGDENTAVTTRRWSCACSLCFIWSIA